jgi:AraC-like DNA-binding protein
METPLLDTGGTYRCLLPKESGRIMLISSDRILYCGLLGNRSESTLGCITLHVTCGEPFRYRVGGSRWKEGRTLLVKPNVPHQVVSKERLIGTLCIEPEYVDSSSISWMQDGAESELGKVASRIKKLYDETIANDQAKLPLRFDVDKALFDGPLPVKSIEPRIKSAIDHIRANPYERKSAEDYARREGLSSTRFLHLFKSETGIPFRRFCKWKRARGILLNVNLKTDLVNIALAAGYPDASHFSHTMREVFGMKAKDMFDGSRRLAVLS